MKYGPAERVLGMFLILLAVLGPARSGTAGATAPQAPTVHTAVPATVAQYGELTGEWDIALGTLADGSGYEPRIPYTDVMDQSHLSADLGEYGANLKHGEDPRNGVTVTAVLTDPGGVTHAPWPVVYYEDMAVAPGTSSTLPYDVAPAGYCGWHLNYRPKALGVWTGHLVVTDAGGTAAGPAFTFTVSGVAPFPEAAAGDLVPATVKYPPSAASLGGDGRDLVYSNTGSLWQPLGEQALGAAGNTPADPDTDSRLATMHAGGARGLLRGRQSSDWPLFNGGGQFEFGRTQTVRGDGNGVCASCARAGRYGYRLTTFGGAPDDGDYIRYHSPPGQSERYGFWVRAVGVNAGATVGMGYGDAYYDANNTSAANILADDQHATDAAGAPLTDGAWHYVSGTLPAMPASEYGFPLYGANGSRRIQAKPGFLHAAGLTSGYWAVDDLCVVEQSHDPSAGPGSPWDLLGGEGDYESQDHLNDRGGAQLDHAVATARANDDDLLLEFFTSRMNSQSAINADGSQTNVFTADAGSEANQEGAYASGPASAQDDGCETAVGLFHSQQVWQWVGRYGWAVGQGIALLDYANELSLQGGPVAGADHWAVQMRRVTPDCRPLCGVCFGGISSGTTEWPWGAYEDAWLQWTEPHQGPGGVVGNASNSPSAVPFNANPLPYQFLTSYAMRQGTGGPSGWGYAEFAPCNGAYPPFASIQLPTLRVLTAQAGRPWTVSYYARTVPGMDGAAWAEANPRAANLAVEGENNGPLGFTGGPGIPPAGLPAWTRLSFQFSPAAGAYTGTFLRVYSGQTHGDLRLSDIQVTDPDGRVFWQARFNEPILGNGNGDAESVWDEAFDYSVSGAAACDRPSVIGEDESYGPTLVTTGGYTTSSAAYPMAQYAARYAAAMPDPRWHIDTWWVEDSMTADLSGASRPFHVMQSLMDNFVTADGTWRAAPTAQSGYAGNAEPLAVYARSNNRSAATGSVVDATKAILSVVPTLPDPNTPHAFLPGTATVDVQGLADATYAVQEYDVATGALKASLTAASAGRHLPLTFTGLGGPLAVKVGPLSAPNLTLKLSVDHATARQGDVVTYTLTYTNAGTAPALSVTVPWNVPAHMQFLSASGGTYSKATNVVNWSLGTLAPGASGSVQLKARVQ